MQINGVNTAGMQNTNSMMGIGQETDAYSRQLQKQISDAQKKLQDVSSDESLSAEEKMKKRQEIQQEINNLNIQLRQHQIELRKEKQNEKSSDLTSAVTELTGGSKGAKSGKGGGQMKTLSDAGMSAIISADAAVKQASIQGNVANRMENRANIIKSEISMESGDTSDKEKALAETEKRAQAASASQMSTLKEADGELKQAERSEEDEDDKKASGTHAKGSGEKASVNDREKRKDDNLTTNKDAEDEEDAAQTVYRTVDIRL